MKESDLKVLIKEVLNELENPPGAGLEEHNYGMFTIADPALEAKVKKAILVYAKQARQLEVAHLKNLTALMAGLGAGDFYSQMRAYDRKQKVPQGITRKVKSVAKISSRHPLRVFSLFRSIAKVYASSPVEHPAHQIFNV